MSQMFGQGAGRTLTASRVPPARYLPHSWLRADRRCGAAPRTMRDGRVRRELQWRATADHNPQESDTGMAQSSAVDGKLAERGSQCWARRSGLLVSGDPSLLDRLAPGVRRRRRQDNRRRRPARASVGAQARGERVGAVHHRAGRPVAGSGEESGARPAAVPGRDCRRHDRHAIRARQGRCHAVRFLRAVIPARPGRSRTSS